MITCKSCGIAKQESEFLKNNTSTCKACRKIYEAAWRNKNQEHVKITDKTRLTKWRQLPGSKEKENKRARRWMSKPENRKKNLDYAKKRQAERQEFLNNIKGVPCKDCGGIFPPYVMDFDHINDDKAGNLSAMKTYHIDKILAEIAKCEIVCSNCHRIRTYKRNNPEA